MKLVILLVGLAIVAWLVATQINTPKTQTFNGVEGAPSGTPQQILDQTRDRAKQIERDAQKRADQAARPPPSN